jgi:hypothetical protein
MRRSLLLNSRALFVPLGLSTLLGLVMSSTYANPDKHQLTVMLFSLQMQSKPPSFMMKRMDIIVITIEDVSRRYAQQNNKRKEFLRNSGLRMFKSRQYPESMNQI